MSRNIIETTIENIQKEFNMNAPITLHIMITTLCHRSCKYCCNKGYDLDEIPTATVDDFNNSTYVCLTGGEPFSFTDPNEYGEYIKTMYPHIQKVWVYSNALELRDYLGKHPNAKLDYLDGISCSIKVPADITAFNELINDERIVNLPDNLCYVFDNLVDTTNNYGNFRMIDRKWQEEFVPAANCIFRRW